MDGDKWVTPTVVRHNTLSTRRTTAVCYVTNLLFIFTDQQRFDTLRAYGNDRIYMPNIDRLAAESFVFQRSYVTQPVCTPSRSTIMTGLFPHTTGCKANNIPLPRETKCLSEMLAPGEFHTGYFGKWHLGDEIFRQHGFDQWRSIEDGYRKYYSPGRDRHAHSSYHDFLTENGFTPGKGFFFTREEAARLPERFGKPAYLAREAIRFIRENRSRPFVLYVNFLEPHMPYFGPRDGQYFPGDVYLPRNFDLPPTQAQPLKTRIFQRSYFNFGHGGQRLKTESDWRALIARYWGLCSLVDTYVGQIIRALKESGIYDDTIIVFTSDHGDMMGSHRLLAKCVMFEEAVRIPLTIKLPHQRNRITVRSPVSQIDLVPTLLEQLSQDVPKKVQGQSLREVMEGTSQRNVFIEWNGPDAGISNLEKVAGDHSVDEIQRAVSAPVRSVVTPSGWKLNLSSIGEHELYDLNKDPFETRNLFGDDRYSDTVHHLSGLIEEWQTRTKDKSAERVSKWL